MPTLSENFKKFMGIVQEGHKSIYNTDYDSDSQNIEKTGEWQGRQDAARHLLAVGNVARATNPTIAKVLSTLNEYVLGIGSTEEDTKMDEHNNELALTLFNAKDYNEVKERVKKLMENPQYKTTVDPNRPVINKLD